MGNGYVIGIEYMRGMMGDEMGIEDGNGDGNGKWRRGENGGPTASMVVTLTNRMNGMNE
jgi:hypothetical protein